MVDTNFKSFGRQIDAIARELSMLAIACQIEVNKEGNAERILNNDETVCGRKNPKAFQQIRRHLMALFPLEEQAIEDLGARHVKETMDNVRAAIRQLRDAGSPSANRAEDV